jgi:hypothetical protein
LAPFLVLQKDLGYIAGEQKKKKKKKKKKRENFCSSAIKGKSRVMTHV